MEKNAQIKLNQARERITKQKNAKPRVPKGQTPPPPKTAEQIAAEIDAEMVDEYRKREEALLNVLEEVGFAWAVGRREQLDFVTLPQKPYLKNFAPTYHAARADWVEIPPDLKVPSDEKKKIPGIAPELAGFLRRLAVEPGTPKFSVGNYDIHGIGDWAGAGFSVDLYLPKASTDQRNFYEPAKALEFLLAIDRTAKALGARWRVVYDDFGVAQKVNNTTGMYNVGFQGSIYKGRLNWHGPAPLILHFHLDLEIKKAAPSQQAQPPLPEGGSCSLLEDGEVCWAEPENASPM